MCGGIALLCLTLLKTKAERNMKQYRTSEAWQCLVRGHEKGYWMLFTVEAVVIDYWYMAAGVRALMDCEGAPRTDVEGGFSREASNAMNTRALYYV